MAFWNGDHYTKLLDGNSKRLRDGRVFCRNCGIALDVGGGCSQCKPGKSARADVLATTKRHAMSKTNEKQRGIYRKYDVKRTDGSSEPGGKHTECSYFVLDLAHDEFAIPALKAYAAACRKQYPALAADIDTIVANEHRPCGCRGLADCFHMRLGPQDENEMAAHLMAKNARKVTP